VEDFPVNLLLAFSPNSSKSFPAAYSDAGE